MATDPSQLLMHLAQAPGLFTDSVFAGRNQRLGEDQAAQQLLLGGQDVQKNDLLLQALQQKQRQQQDYDTSVSEFTKDPTPDRLMGLIARFPDQYQALKGGWDLKDTAQRTSDLRFFSEVHGALQNNKPDLAIKTIEGRLQAEKAAGLDTTEEEKLLEQLRAGDPNAVGAVKAYALANIASATGPDKFASTYGAVNKGDEGFTLGPGMRRFDATGKEIASAPFAPRPVTVGEGDTVVEYQPGGGDPASDRGTVDRMLEITPFAESGGREYNGDGSRVTSPKGARGVMQVMPHTAKDPGYGLKPSNGTPADDARLGREYLAKMMEVYGNPAQAWAAYNAGPGAVDSAIQKGGDKWLQQLPKETQNYVAKNMVALRSGQQSGGSRVIAQGAPKQKDAPSGYQWAQDGSLEPIPGGPADKGKSGAGKAVPEWVAKRAEPKYTALTGLQNAVNTFKDEFGGHTILGDMSNDVQGITGLGPEGQRDWWAQFAALDNQIRNALFGASLTEGEKAAYNRTTITPRMNASQIRKNLNERLNIAKRVAQRERGFLKANGYDQSTIDELLPPLEGAGATAAPVKVRSIQEARALPPGTVFITPDGRRKVRP